MSGFCKVEITGHASKDAEFRTTAKGKQLCIWSVAVGNKQYTQWHNCQAWGEVAIIAANIKKGDYFSGKGTIQYNKYNDKLYTNIVLFEVTIGAEQGKKVEDIVVGADGETYEVVADEPKADEPLPF